MASSTSAALVACSGGSDADLKKGSAGAPADTSGILFGSGDGGLSSAFDSRCVSEIDQAEAKPLDLYMLFDQSGSMSTPTGPGSRLDAVRAATTDFLNAKESDGLGVGIGYFGSQPIGKADCNAADYETPAVGVGTLPEHAGAMLASLQSVAPTGETPTGPAITGACHYLATWKAAHPGREIALLLITDGIPEAPVSRAHGCDPTLPEAVTAATECVKDTGAKIYVLGVGPSLSNLDQIAAAGGTNAAYLVDGGDVSAKVAEALGAIRGTALPCDFVVPAAPSGQTLNLDQVNVVVTDSSGKRQGIYNVPDATACSGGGWFYGGSAGKTITLCDETCRFVKSQSVGGSIEFALGCKTQTVTR